MDQFTRMEMLANIEKAPPVKFHDLENLITSVRISYATLPMLSHVDYLRITDSSVMTNITVQFEHRDLSFQLKDGVEKAAVNLLGRIYTMTERPVTTFEKTLDVPVPEGMMQQYAGHKALYQESLPLAPGRYKLVLAAKDIVSGNVNLLVTVLDVPRFAAEKLSMSNLILADRIERLPIKQTGGAMFAIGDWKVRPRIDARFSRDEKLGLYTQVYNLGSAARIEYQILRTGTQEIVAEFSEELARGAQVSIGKFVSLASLEPGDFILRLKVQDGERTAQQEARFTVTSVP
jgi:hypothetical protein